MAQDESKDIFTRFADWLTEKIVDGAVIIYRLFKRKKPMVDKNVPDNGKRDKQQGGVTNFKIIMTPSSHDVKFADFAQVVLTPTHGILKFGLRQAGTDDVVMHTQVVMSPQAITGFAEGLKQQIEKIKEQQNMQGQGRSPMEE